MADLRWRRSDDWVGSQIEDSWVMLNFATGEYVAMNETAKAIWSALEEPRGSEAIVADLVSAYDVDPDRCRNAVEAVVRTFAEKGLVAVEG